MGRFLRPPEHTVLLYSIYSTYMIQLNFLHCRVYINTLKEHIYLVISNSIALLFDFAYTSIKLFASTTFLYQFNRTTHNWRYKHN